MHNISFQTTYPDNRNLLARAESGSQSYLRRRGCHRFGFNGKEKVDELFESSGSAYDFGARLYDSRLGRWMKCDRYSSEYIPISPYCFGLNNPIFFIDKDGNIIWDPITNKEVKVEYDNQGNAYFCTEDGTELSNFFITHSLPTLQILSASEVGREIINDFSSLPSRVIIDPEDKRFTESTAQSDWLPGNDIYGNICFDDYGFYEEIVVAPHFEKIQNDAEKGGVSFEERFTVVMSVEKNHLNTLEQINTENSTGYIDGFRSAKNFGKVYQNLLNEAIRVGIRYRTEKGLPISNSSFAPIEGITGKNRKHISLDAENSKTKNESETPDILRDEKLIMGTEGYR